MSAFVEFTHLKNMAELEFQCGILTTQSMFFPLDFNAISTYKLEISAFVAQNSNLVRKLHSFKNKINGIDAQKS